MDGWIDGMENKSNKVMRKGDGYGLTDHRRQLMLMLCNIKSYQQIVNSDFI